MAAKIGIKLADGTFFPIMDDDFSASETLELTTVRNDQRSVQINLFRKEDDVPEPAYIGSLIVEDIHERAAGDPTIELRLSLDEQKNLSVEALDKDSGSHQALRVSLENLTDQSFGNLDFDLNSETGEADIDLSTAQAMDTDALDDPQAFSAISFYNNDDEAEDPAKKHGFPIWLLILLILLGVAALVLGILLLTKKSLAEDDSPVTVRPDQVIIVPAKPEPPQDVQVQKTEPALPTDSRVTEPPTPAPEQPAAEPSAPQQDKPAVPQPDAADSSADSENAAVPESANTAVPETKNAQATETSQSAAETSQGTVANTAVSAGKAVRYTLRWGDTLWDLSETYYRTPWLYTKIAEHNKLTNPDWVMSGTTIEIPPQ